MNFFPAIGNIWRVNSDFWFGVLWDMSVKMVETQESETDQRLLEQILLESSLPTQENCRGECKMLCSWSHGCKRGVTPRGVA